MRRTPFRVVAMLCLVVQAAPLAPIVRPALAQEPVSRVPAIQRGWEFWNEEKYSEALELLRNVLKTNPTLGSQDRIQALRLIAQCSLQLGDEAASQDAFCQILKAQRTWTPDTTIFTGPERAVFAKAKATCKLPGSIARNPWVWGLGLLAIGGGIAAASGGGGGGGTDGGGATALPPPPNPPGN